MPYWAYVWAGGAALARHLLDHPQTVIDKRVADLGTGSGLVAIAAALAGAREVVGVDADPNALAALAMNAAANGVEVHGMLADVATADPIQADVIVAGDLFYEEALAERTICYLERCAAAGGEILVGDPWRNPLPVGRLKLLAEYEVPDFGDNKAGAFTSAGVFGFSGWQAGADDRT